MTKVVLPNEVLIGEVAELLNAGREVVMTPKGNSMLPFIRGDVDNVRLRKPESLHVGDIVLARFGGRYVMHRIIALDGDMVTLMGDGNLQGTEKGSRSEVRRRGRNHHTLQPPPQPQQRLAVAKAPPH